MPTGLVGAFEYIGSVRAQVLFDNASTVITEQDAYGEGLHRWHSGMRERANTYGFLPRVYRPYRAKPKGKVERRLKDSFLVPPAATPKAGGLRLVVDTANRAVLRWLDDVANRRVHGTTGERSDRRLAIE